MGARPDRSGVRGQPVFFGLISDHLLEFAEHSFALNKSDKKGTSQREHLEQVAKMTGRVPQELVPPEFPELATYVWEAFLDLHKGRSYGMSGGNPLTWADIQAWCNLNGIVLSSWEVSTIKALDMAWVRISNEGEG